MREIKFRIWSNKTKGFLHRNYELDFNLWQLSNRIGNSLVDLKSEYVFQQFTGCYDKNDKPIYEGDIVKYQYDSAYPDKFDLSVVEFEEFEPDKWGYQLGQGYGNVTVIGNIFENKDLVKDTTNIS